MSDSERREKLSISLIRAKAIYSDAMARHRLERSEQSRRSVGLAWSALEEIRAEAEQISSVGGWQ